MSVESFSLLKVKIKGYEKRDKKFEQN